MIFPYSRSTRSDERWRFRVPVGAAALAIVLGGCSFGIPSMLPGDGDEVTTGSLKPADGRLSPALDPEDWRRARNALAVALDLQGNGQAVKWDNPDSKRHGDVNPVGSPFVENDEVCRRFLATVTVPDGRTSAHDGQACKVSADEWAIKSVRHSTPR